jgi:hypothetical protein
MPQGHRKRTGKEDAMTDTNFNDRFERIETKYLMHRTQYEALWKRLDAYMQVDAYGLSTIENIYYDTPGYDLIRTSLDKPVYKEKLRLRSYGIPEDGTPVFLEIKKKYKDVVYKRRVSMPLKKSSNYLTHGIKPDDMNQIGQEIDYFISFYRPEPKMFIAYDRIATFGREDAGLRITFDFRIRSREDDLDLSHGDRGELLLDDDMVLMEIKIGGAYPLWLADILNEMKIYPASFSKYGNCYKKKLAAEAEQGRRPRIVAAGNPEAVPADVRRRIWATA